MSLCGRKNLPVGSSISSWAGAPTILDDTPSASRIGALNARFARRSRSCALSSTAPLSASGSIESTELVQVFRDFAVSLCLLTARTPRRSGHRHRCVAHLAECRESRVTAKSAIRTTRTIQICASEQPCRRFGARRYRQIRQGADGVSAEAVTNRSAIGSQEGRTTPVRV